MASRQEAERAVFITGVSTGIGAATARFLVGRGMRVFGSVRRRSDAEGLQNELGDRFTSVVMDVTDAEAVREAALEVGARIGNGKLAGLVNNAGIAVGGPLLHLAADEFRRQLEVNLIGSFVVTQAFAPLLGADRSREGVPGRIVNMSSVGGKFGPPFLGPYVASKHALEGMSDSLRRELLLYGIDVIVIGPGAVVTPIWEKAESVDPTLYAKTDYAEILRRFADFFIAEGRKGLPAERVAEVVYTALTNAKPKVRYAVVPQRFKNWTLPMLLPKRWIDRAIGKQLGISGGPRKHPI